MDIHNLQLEIFNAHLDDYYKWRSIRIECIIVLLPYSDKIRLRIGAIHLIK